VVWGSAQRISKARWAGALPVHGAGTVHTCRRHALGVSDDHDERTPPLAKPLQALCYELSTDASALVRRPDCHRPECRPYLRPHRQRTEQNVAHDGAIRDGNESQRDDPSVANGVDDATFPLLIEGLPIQLPNGIDIRRLFFPDLNHVFLALSAERSAAAAARSAVRCMLLLAGAPRCPICHMLRSTVTNSATTCTDSASRLDRMIGEYSRFVGESTTRVCRQPPSPSASFSDE
jgi:hypothetical protein